MIRDDIMRNRPGTAAADFTFETVRGDEATALDPDRSHTTLLMFYDPDCDDCHRIISRLRNDAALQRRLSMPDAFASYSSTSATTATSGCATPLHSPPAWTIGIDDCGTVDDGDLYVIRTTPSIYLIAADGTVLLKDPSLAALTATL